MRLDLLTQPTIPIAYGVLILEVAAERGVTRETMLAGASIPAKLWDAPDARLTIVQAGGLLYRALQLSKDSALGYEIGLRSSLTSHGFMGYGVLSQPTMRDVVEFGAKFLQLRLPTLSMHTEQDGDWVSLVVTETVPQGAVRQCMYDLFLVGLWRVALNVDSKQTRHGVEIWFDYPEPPYYARYKARLPPTRFSMPRNQLRMLGEALDRPLKTHNPLTAKLVTQQCEKELSELGFDGDFIAQIRAQLMATKSAFPDLEALATRLHMSSRTLKRKLQQHGTQFQALLDEARRSEAIRLLQDSPLSIEAIAERIGYTDRANFTRAFRKWTGVPPSKHRESRR